MWHNILPDATYKTFVRERRVRLGVAFGVVLAWIVGVSAFAQVPAVVQVVGRYASARLQAVDAPAQRATVSHAQELLANWQLLAGAQERAHEGKAFAAFLTFLREAIPEGVEVERLALQPASSAMMAEGKGVQGALSGSLRGRAASRTSLKAFEDALRALPGMREVSVPLEAYAARRDLEYTLSFRWEPPSPSETP